MKKIFSNKRIWGIMLFLFLLLALTPSTFAKSNSTATVDDKPRYDGMYIAHDRYDSLVVLRFYENGTVIRIQRLSQNSGKYSTFKQLVKVISKWFNIDSTNSNIEKGKYSMNDNYIQIQWPNNSDNKGDIENDYLTIYGGTKGEYPLQQKLGYTFVPLDS